MLKVDPKAPGIEIGPSYNPVASKKEGYDVHIIDHLDQSGLRRKYAGHNNVNIDNIEEVDFIFNGESYARLTGRTEYYQWIIASHVIEHTPNLIGFIQNCEEILRRDGVISLIVPDARFCFDSLRVISSISKVIDAHLEDRKVHSPGTIFEYFANVVRNGNRITWRRGDIEDLYLVHSLEQARNSMNLMIKEGKYIDLHSWCFTPTAFRLLIEDLFYLGFINCREEVFFETTEAEFYITLSFQGKGLGEERIQLLKDIKAEIGLY